MTTEEDLLKLQSLKQEQEELERKLQQTMKPGVAGIITNANNNDEIEIINQESPTKSIQTNPPSNFKLSLLKEKLLASPRASIKELKTYMVERSGINLSDNELKSIIKEADNKKYNELYPVIKTMKSLSVKKHPMIKWSKTEHQYIIKHLKETNNNLPETRRRFIHDDPDNTKRTSNAISLYIKKQIYKLTNKTPKILTTSVNTSFTESIGTPFTRLENDILYPEFDKIIQLDKSIIDYPEVYTKYKSSSPNHIKSIKSVSDHFYHYRKKYKKSHKESTPINHNINQPANKPINDNQHILGVRVLELIRSGEISQNILTTYKITIRELLTIPDVKPEEMRSAIKVLESLKL